MFKIILNWCRGFLLIRITGAHRERFINICTKNNIKLWGLTNEKDSIITYIGFKDYKNCKEYLKKTDVTITIIERKGLPFFIKKYRKRYGFMIGMVLFYSLIYGFTMFIWDINVSGESVYTKEQIIKDVRDNYVNILTPKEEINCDELEKILREKYDKVAWISCEIRGTQLNINITETIDKNEIVKSEDPCNIVAIKDGVITDIIVRNGKKTRNIGDEVKKGDIIITGAVNIYNDYDELLETNYVASDGDVYAIVNNEYYDEFDLYYYDKQYTGEESKSYGVIINDNSYFPFGFEPDYSLYDQVITEEKLKLGTSIYLPVSFNKIVSKEYETVPCVYSETEATEKGQKRLQIYIDELQKKGVEILENNVTIVVNEEKCIISGTIVTKELIGVPEELTIIDQGEDP